MAKAQENKNRVLSDADRQTLLNLEGSIAKSEKAIEIMEKLGLGVGELRSRLEWAKRSRQILLDEG